LAHQDGYRGLANRSALRADFDVTGVDLNGYCPKSDLTLRARDAGCAITEAPIRFRERELAFRK